MVSASNQLGKATSTAHVTIEAASSDEEFAMKTVTSTKKTVTASSSVQSSTTSMKKTTKTSVQSASNLPPGLNPTDAQKQFASVFASVGGTKKKKKVKKVKVESSAETEYETAVETEATATDVCYTETEAEMSSMEQMTRQSPAVPQKPSPADLIKKPQIDITSPLTKKREIAGFRSVQAVTGKVHNVSQSKRVSRGDLTLLIFSRCQMTNCYLLTVALSLG